MPTGTGPAALAPRKLRTELSGAARLAMGRRGGLLLLAVLAGLFAASLAATPHAAPATTPKPAATPPSAHTTAPAGSGHGSSSSDSTGHGGGHGTDSSHHSSSEGVVRGSPRKPRREHWQSVRARPSCRPARPDLLLTSDRKSVV